MATTSRRSSRPRNAGRARPLPVAERLSKVRELEDDVAERYGIRRVSFDLRSEVGTWQARVIVPAYEARFTLHIEVTRFGYASVTVEDWTGERMKHTYGGNRLCMWYPSDPDDRQWQYEDGLTRLVDTAVVHLFKELYWREHGEWLGDEAPHAVRKDEDLRARARAV